jgi:hypothetical protein
MKDGSYWTFRENILELTIYRLKFLAIAPVLT